MQPRFRILLPLIPVAGLMLFLGCNNGGAGVGDGSSLKRVNTAPTATLDGISPTESPLIRFKPYTFFASATDPDIGDSISQFEWDFGDGTPLITSVAGHVTHSYGNPTTTGANATVRVRAYDSFNLAGPFASRIVSLDSSNSPITATFQSPAGAVTLQADAVGGVLLTYTIKVVSTSSGTIGLLNVVFNPGDSLATVVSSQSVGGGVFNFVVNYRGSISAGTRVANPTVQVTDSTGISSDVVSGPVVTINTLSSANHQPVIVVTDPATPTSAGFTTKPVSLGFTITDPDSDVVTYTVDWGDGTPVTTSTTTGNTSAGVNIALTHAFPDSFTSSTRNTTITISATDGRTNNGVAQSQTRIFSIRYNTFPTATISSPQASGSLPSSADLPSNPAIGLVNPPGPNDPDLVVIPSGGKITFIGSGGPPGSGEAALTYSWTFQGGIPSTSNSANPGEVIFNANPGVITPLLAELKVTDVFGRVSSSGPGANAKTYRKWIIVDGKNTQQFKLSFLYRLKADNNGVSSVAPVKSGANGLGATINIFQDGQTNSYKVQDQSGQALATIPVRSNLPFFVLIPSFGTDTTSYLMRIPNAPTGAFRDPSLGTVLANNASTFGFENTIAPFNPTLKIVTGQGFAPETQAAQQRHIVGSTLVPGATAPPNVRWIDRLSVARDTSDSLGALNQWVQNSNAAATFDVVGNQSFAEWITVLKTVGANALAELPVADPTTTAGTPDLMGFVLNYPKYIGDTQPSESFTISRMQAFRAPGGVTDPYDTVLAGSNNPAYAVNLNPQKVAGSAATFFNTSVYGNPGATPLGGGIQNLAIPYDANDPDRIPYQARTYPFNNIRMVFSFSEYLWSTVWARPLVLNQASLNYSATIALGSYPYFRMSNPATWPKSTTGITPDNSQFDLTVSNGGTFDASSPVAIGGVSGSTGVGRFYWTAFTPYYPGGGKSAVISRTWLAAPSGQPPNTFSGTSSDATSAFGFVPPLDVVVDKRGRNADGSLNGNSAGGYRVTWFNATKDASGNPVPPDFWVVELTGTLGTQHFMLPGDFPADPQKTTDLILTDARTFLPSGRTAAQGPAVDGSDKVGPGYCWFDLPVELRPASGSGSLTLTVFATKSILRNNAPAGARPLNRPDWLDAIKTASASITLLPLSGDVSYAHKIPFNFYWDIVVTNGARVLVAP